MSSEFRPGPFVAAALAATLALAGCVAGPPTAYVEAPAYYAYPGPGYYAYPGYYNYPAYPAYGSVGISIGHGWGGGWGHRGFR